MRSLKRINELYRASKNEATTRVLLCFLSQPKEIGQCADRLRCLNYDNPDDYRTYSIAVAEDFNRLIKDNPHKELMSHVYHFAWEVMDGTRNDIPPFVPKPSLGVTARKNPFHDDYIQAKYLDLRDGNL